MEFAGCVPVVAGLAPKRLGVAPEVAPELDAGGAELPPPRPGKAVEPAVVVVGPLVAVVVALLVAVVSAAVDAGGLPQLKLLLPPADAGVLEPAPAKRPPLAGADDAGAVVFPPNDGVEPVEAGVEPRLNPRGLAGVAEGVVLPRLPKRPDLGAACPSCVPAVAF